MIPPLAVAAVVQSGAGLLAAAAGVGVLVARGARARAWAVLLALVCAALALATLGGATSKLTSHPALIAAAAAGGLLVVAGLGLLLRGRPGLIVPLAFATVPFRIPVPIGNEDAYLLVLLYGVIAAGALGYVLRALRDDYEPPPRLRRISLALAVVLALYAIQATYSSDVEQAIKNIGFFYVPFAVLFRLLADLEWTPRRVKEALVTTGALALLFALIGIAERATRHLLIVNTKVETANELKPYFRVNSLFFDPNIYGRYLALTMVALATVMVWRRTRREVGLLAFLLGVLWAGLVVSLSESSFTALLVGLAVVAAVRWRPAPVIALIVVGAIAGGVLLVAGHGKDLNRVTSGRSNLVKGGLEMARDRPIAGYGSGSFADRYRERRRVFNPTVPAESHTIPITVAAEQGAIGLIGYIALLVVAVTVLFRRLRDFAPDDALGLARVAVAACFAAQVVHTLVYASFLEDPLTWTLLAAGTALAAIPAAAPVAEESRGAEKPRFSRL